MRGREEVKGKRKGIWEGARETGEEKGDRMSEKEVGKYREGKRTGSRMT